MMQTLVEFDDTLGKDYYFVTVVIEGTRMTLHSVNTYCKGFEKTIDLTQLSDLEMNGSGLQTLHFSCDEENYFFVDYGNAVVDYIKRHLPVSQPY